MANLPGKRPLSLRAEAWKPPLYELADAVALQALERGVADEIQQKRALRWIVEAAAATYDQSYRPDSDRDTAFAEGRRFVGLNTVLLLKLDTAKLRSVENA